MLADMTERQWREWQAFAVIYPFGEDVRDGRFARLMGMYAAVHTPKGRKAQTADKFMLPQYGKLYSRPKPVGPALKKALGINGT